MSVSNADDAKKAEISYGVRKVDILRSKKGRHLT